MAFTLNPPPLTIAMVQVDFDKKFKYNTDAWNAWHNNLYNNLVLNFAPTGVTAGSYTVNGGALFTVAASGKLTAASNVVITVTGTSNRITVSGGTGITPTIDIAATYVGQTSITTLGTIVTGVWNGTAIITTYGGTGLTTYTQGDLLYYDTGTTLTKLAKDTNSTRYLSNQGTNNNPSWNQVNLANGVTGTLPAANGGTGVTALGDLTRVDDTNVTLALGGTPVGALIQSVSITAGWAGTLGVTRGGTGFGTATQGDIIYSDASNSFAKLAKDTNATRYLSNTGSSNNPAWTQIDLTNGVTGDLPYANLAQGSALSVLGVTGNSTADNASIAAGTDNQVLRRSGTSVAFGAVNIASTDAITGTLAVGNGGTGQTSYTNGQLLIGNTTGNTLAKSTLTAGQNISITNGSGTITVATDTILASGTYTPTLTNGTNVASSSLPYGDFNYLRVGSFITVSGAFNITPTAAAPTLTDIGISLPVASNFAAINNLSGVGHGNAIDQGGITYADTTNDRAKFEFLANSTTEAAIGVHFTYQVI